MLTDGTITLRAPEPDDLDALYRWENDADHWISAATHAPVSRLSLWNYIQNYDGDIFRAGQLRLMIVAGSETVGTIDLTDFDATNRRAFVGIYVAEAFRGKNYGAAALQLLSSHCERVIGMHQLVAVTLVDNEASNALFRACGFQSAGRLRSWVRQGRRYLDALMWQRLFPTD